MILVTTNEDFDFMVINRVFREDSYDTQRRLVTVEISVLPDHKDNEEGNFVSRMVDVTFEVMIQHLEQRITELDLSDPEDAELATETQELLNTLIDA